VAFDPLDGSSIVDANFAVGSIFGVWPGPTPLGQTGRDQVAAMYSLYGPRTLFVLAFVDGNGEKTVHQYIQRYSQQQHQDQQQRRQQHQQQQDQQQQGQQQQQRGGAASSSGQQQQQQREGDEDHPWVLHRIISGLRHTKIIAPANLRAAADNEAYRSLMDVWITKGYKLRYSGGMVPDVHHILAKVGLWGCGAGAQKRQSSAGPAGAGRGLGGVGPPPPLLPGRLGSMHAAWRPASQPAWRAAAAAVLARR
jgi:fructose-1,6-bisphosphatase